MHFRHTRHVKGTSRGTFNRAGGTEDYDRLVSVLEGSVAELRLQIARLTGENSQLRRRLEIDFVYDLNHNKIPWDPSIPDGIACRDETIKVLKEQVAQLTSDLRW